MTWDSFQPLLSNAWEQAFKKQQLYTELGLTTTENRDSSHVSTQLPTSRDHSDLKAIDLHCGGCGAKFVFTIKQQQEYKGRGFDQPKRCPQCRGNQKMCEHFASTGACPFGDSCKYRHQADIAASTATVGHRLAALAPGQYPTTCKHFANNTCENGDESHFTHPARIKTAAVDQVPNTGFVGLQKRQ
jgi:hypothetical protein